MYNLGNLEETILLLVMIMDEPYGYALAEEYKRQTDQSISISAVHTVLMRLEKKGLILSKMSGATQDRGGRRKRICTPTESGREAIMNIRTRRMKLWSQIPGMD
ncbi:MAG: hypothetical protein Roseis2KO_13280 [Roseivirga sp.]